MAIYPAGGGGSISAGGGYDTSSCSSRRQNYWSFKALLIMLCFLIGYIIYDVIMATAAELFQRLLIISPLLIIFVVHWLSPTSTAPPSSSLVGFLFPGSDPDDIHRAGGSPWGVAFLLIVLFFLISYQPSFYGLLFN